MVLATLSKVEREDRPIEELPFLIKRLDRSGTSRSYPSQSGEPLFKNGRSRKIPSSRKRSATDSRRLSVDFLPNSLAVNKPSANKWHRCIPKLRSFPGSSQI